MNDYHLPVLLKESICSLNIKKGKNYLDCTLGGGGHAKEILVRQGNVLGIDVDIDAIKYAEKFLEASPQSIFGKAIIHQGNFADLKKIVDQYQFYPISGVLFDLGVSSHQLDSPERGFSFNTDAILDMRMEQTLKVKAFDLVNGLNEGELYELFQKLGEENLSRAVARAITFSRKLKKIETGRELAGIVQKVYQSQYRTQSKINPATKVFQALRIAVNDELNNLKTVLPEALDILEPEGRIVIISFHSLEDRIVKDFFKEKEEQGKIKIITKHPIVPSAEEISVNPKSRSAKMRVGEKI